MRSIYLATKQILLVLIVLAVFTPGCQKSVEKPDNSDSKASQVSTERTKTSTGKYPDINFVVPKKPGNTKPKESPKDANSLQLVPMSSSPNEIIDEERWFKRNGLSLPCSAGFGKPYGSKYKTPKNIPERLIGAYLSTVIFQNNGYLALYGFEDSSRQYLVFFDLKFKVKNALDFSNYSVAPDFLPENNSRASVRLIWATEENGILYTSHGSEFTNNYINAIDLKTNRMIWQARGLIANAESFVIIGDHIVSGYGYSQKPDNLFIINKYNGQIVRKIPLKTSPKYLVLKNGSLYVRTYNMDYVFLAINSNSKNRGKSITF